jgi:hypothetical protein
LLEYEIEKKNTIKEPSKTKEMTIKIMGTKFDTKINWYKILRGEVKNKIQLEKR